MALRKDLEDQIAAKLVSLSNEDAQRIVEDYPSLRPPVDATRPPAFHEMNEHPKRFERMSMKLLTLDERFRDASLLGIEGEVQYGADAVAQCRDGGTAVLSAKCYSHTTPAKLSGWSDEFLRHHTAHWKEKDVRHFVLATAATNTTSTKVREQIEKEGKRFANLGMEYEVWGPEELYDRLRGSSEAVRRFLGEIWVQIIYGQAETKVRSPRDAPFLVPRAPHPFIGRDTDISTVSALLKSHEAILIKSRLGGIGKTALALELAHLNREHYPDGVFWIECESLSPTDALQLVVRAINPKAEREAGAHDARDAAFIYGNLIKDRRSLIIFDGIREDYDISLLAPPGTSSAFVLTSRFVSDVNLAGLCEYELELLLPKAADNLLAKLCPGLESERHHIAALVEELGRLPLGIRLAAKAIRNGQFSIQSYLHEFRQSRDLAWLDYGIKEAGIAKSFSISYNALPTELERRFFRCLGLVKRVPVPLEAISFCLGEQLDIVKHGARFLIRYGLCDWLRRQGSVTLHPLLRRFASQLAAQDHDTLELRTRLAEWSAKQVSFRNTDGSYSFGMAFTEDDLAYGQDAVRYFLEADDRAEAQRTLEAIADPLTRFGRHDTLLELLDDMAKDGQLSDWLMLYKADLVFMRLAPGDAATTQLSIQPLTESADKKLASAALICLAKEKYREKDFSESKSLFEQSKAMKEGMSPPDEKGTAFVLNELARISLRMGGDQANALKLHSEALKIQKTIGDEKGAAHSLRRIGSIYLNEGNKPREAIEYLEEASHVAEKVGSRLIRVHSLIELAEARRRLGEYRSAVGILISTRDLAKKSSDPFTEGLVARRLGQIYEKLEALGDAKNALSDAMNLFPDGRDREQAWDALGRVQAKISVVEDEIARLDKQIANLSDQIERATQGIARDELRRSRRHAARLRKRFRQRLGLEQSQIRMGV